MQNVMLKSLLALMVMMLADPAQLWAEAFEREAPHSVDRQPAAELGLVLIRGAGGVPAVRAVVQNDPDLPPAAGDLLKGFENESNQIRARMDAEIAAKREALIRQLQAMQDGFTREAKLDEAVAIRDVIRRLRREGMTILQYPSVSSPYGSPMRMMSYRGQDGKVLHFEVTGATSGSVYGTGVYTDDSDLASVCVHAGLLKVGEKGVVKVTILPGQATYASSTANGITSYSWSNYPGSYKVEAIPGGSRGVTATSRVLPDPDRLWSYEKSIGQTLEFQVTGNASGGVIWGTGIYTADSPLCVAAVHSGVLRDGESGVVKVTILPAETRYLGSTRNGVTSWDYGSYSFSYRVESAAVSATAPPATGPVRIPLHPRILRLNQDPPGKVRSHGATVIPESRILENPVPSIVVPASGNVVPPEVFPGDFQLDPVPVRNVPVEQKPVKE